MTDALIIATGRTGYSPGGFSKALGFPKGYKPKCLLNFEDEIILERAVKLLRKHGVKKIVVVVNYKAGEIRDFARTKMLNLFFTEIPELSMKKSVKAFFAGLKDVGDEFILLPGDVILSEKLLPKVLKSTKSCIVCRSNTEIYFGKIIKKELDDEKEITKIAKKHRFPIVEGLCKYFIKSGADIISSSEHGDEKSYFGDIDYFSEVAKWEKGSDGV